MPATRDPLPPPAPPAARPWLGRTVASLAIVSLLTDVSSEMIAPLLPILLTTSLGASARTVGAIEGAAETTAALLKLASGWWSDRVSRRKPLVVAGYVLASVARPLVAAATSAGQVMAVRLADRVGKGIRSAPRDAMLAAAVPPEVRGRAFGLHRAADHLGAVLGPLLAFVLLEAAGVPLRTVFWLAAIPGALAVLVLVLGVREGAAPVPAVRARPAEPSGVSWRPPRALRPVLGALLLFTAGHATDAFLVLRATQLGVPVALIPVLWAALHAVKSVASTPGGALSDRVGRRPVIAAGWTVHALVYVGLAAAADAWHVWALMLVYGVRFGLTEGAEKALVAELAPERSRGAAFGWYHLVVGLAALPGALAFGAVWDRWGAPASFASGAALAIAATLVLLGADAPDAQQQREPGRS